MADRQTDRHTHTHTHIHSHTHSFTHLHSHTRSAFSRPYFELDCVKRDNMTTYMVEVKTFLEAACKHVHDTYIASNQTGCHNSETIACVRSSAASQV